MVDRVFAEENRSHLAYWYFRQIIMNLCLKVLILVKNELALNKTVSFYFYLSHS